MNFDQIIIRSSPFIRCIMTSSQLAQSLGLTKISINHQLSEYLSSFLFEECPIENLEINKKGVK